ncbi:hypothetical protein P691DRAFT_764744 [Macrolepiota fuliginosa MF-IS2]|uniref:Uncharacterized protein n=1 Tax=Macrolepiota fuliginosa MF-IS2 TaxID=1400762 RepID=A0A9P5X1T6_9AGAR|nr:hypothetical protein P691DRAFT_764744 [Macrolepiota fuliginosa MF-IS2]
MLAYTLEKDFTLGGQVQCLSFLPGGRYLAIGIDGQVCVWDTTSWVLDLQYHRNGVLICSLTWDLHGQLFFGCSDGLLTIVTFGEKEYCSKGFCTSQQPIKFIAINPSGNFRLALGEDSEVTIWSFQGVHSLLYHGAL